MGVEYAHWFFVDDLDWIGDIAVARRVHAFLEERGLGGTHVVFDISAGKKSKAEKALGKLPALPNNSLVVYDTIAEGPSVAELLGPSAFGLDPTERYLQRRLLVIGDEYRTMPLDEGILVQTEGGAWADKHTGFEGQWFSAGNRPQAVVKATVPFPEGFGGVYRAGLCLDCGKDLPAMAEGSRVIGDPSVKALLEGVFDTALVEVGIVY